MLRRWEVTHEHFDLFFNQYDGQGLNLNSTVAILTSASAQFHLAERNSINL